MATTLLLGLISTACVIDTRPDGGADGVGGGTSTSGGGSGGGGAVSGGGVGSTGGGGTNTGGGVGVTGGGDGSTGGGSGVTGGGSTTTGGGTANPPAAPVLEEANAGNARVDLEWSYVSGAYEYDVLSGTDASSLTVARTVQTRSAAMTGLTNDTTYFFAVIARGAGGDSPRSNVLQAMPRAPALDVIGTTPDAGATGVPRDQTIELRFSNAVLTSSTMLTITPTVGLDWDWNGGNTRLELAPTGGTFAANTTYTLTLSAARSSSGNLQLRAPYALTFTTGALPLSVEETVPQVTDVTPMNGAVDVITNPNLTVTFNKRMTWASVSNALSLTPDAGISNCAQQLNYTQFRCSTGALARGTTYTLRVGTGATSFDDGGLTLPTPFTSTFTTVAPDTTRPTVVSFTPTVGEQGQQRTPEVRVTFSEAMDCASVRAAFSFVSPARTLSSLGSCSGSQTSFVFQPSSAYAHGDTVTWQLGTGATDVAGNALAAATNGSFRVARVATQTLQVVAALEGTVTDAGVIDTSGTSLRVGTLAGNLEQRAFLTFDLAQLPAGTVGIHEATLNITQTGTTGQPFQKFSNVGAYGLDYGSSLDATDYWTSHDTHLDYIVIPVPPFIIPMPMPDYTSVSAAASALPVTRTVDVSQQTSRQWGERTQRGSRMQLRLTFLGINEPDGGTNATGTNDEVRFNSSKAFLDKPTLVVDYEYP